MKPLSRRERRGRLRLLLAERMWVLQPTPSDKLYLFPARRLEDDVVPMADDFHADLDELSQAG
jgi:hypothetical protein